MIRSSLRPYFVLGGLIALLLVITAGAGVFEKGLYGLFLPAELVAFQYFQDLVSLAFAPALLIVMIYARRGSARAFILWAGILVYVLYYYAFYGFGMVYTAYYPLYLALMGLSGFSLIGLLTSVDLEAFQGLVTARMPVRFIAIVLGMSVLFVPIWLGMLMQGIAAQQASGTALVFVLDLSFLIPAIAYTAVQVCRRCSVGYLLSGVFLFKATVSGILLTGGELLKMQRGLPPAMDQLGMYVFLAVAGALGLVLYMRNLQAGPQALAQQNDWQPAQQ
jgi:hypothetical protein